MKKIKRFILVFSLLCILAIAVKTGVNVHDWQTLAEAMIANQPSKVVNVEGETIAEIGCERKRENVSFSQVPDNLKQAYVAIEDERFYRHFGVDVKRTAAAIGSYVIHLGKASFGASTITQQLAKNITGDDANSISRKVSEWGRAVSLEWCMSKDEILEAYLNIIYVGPNVYGVGAGAQYYFSKKVDQLTLEECAFLAGINHAPNAYNPFNKDKDNTEKIEKRTKVVLGKMQELGNITNAEYEEAVAKVEAGLAFKKGKFDTKEQDIYSYHVDALLSEVISDFAKKKNVSTAFATNYLSMANARIYSAQDDKIQEEMEKEFAKTKYQLKSQNGADNEIGRAHV